MYFIYRTIIHHKFNSDLLNFLPYVNHEQILIRLLLVKQQS